MVFNDYNTMYSDSFSCFKLKKKRGLGQSSLEENLVIPENLGDKTIGQIYCCHGAACMTQGKPSDVVFRKVKH